MKKILFLTTLMAGIFAHAQTLWECDFGKTGLRDWKIRTLLHDMMEGRVRVKVASDAPGNYGSFYRYVPSGAPDCYLQVRMGGLENSAAAPRAANVSNGGKGFGILLPGWNTFSLKDVNRKTFALSFAQNGSRDKAGAWVDYISARIVKIPQNGLTVTLTGDDGVAGVGDKLLFRYYAADTLADGTLEAACFIAPQFVDYRFSKNPVIQLKRTDGNIYEAQIEITADALTYKSDPKTPLMAMVKTGQEASFFTLPFEVDVKTANAVPKALTAAADPQVRRDRQQWFDRIAGINLAQGKAVRMNPPPDYRLTTNDTDPADLTDGKLTVRTDDKIWFDKNAVGWYLGNGEAYLQLDLGEEQPLDRLVIRCLGGTSGNFKFPKQFDLYVSKDGNTWFNAASMQKLMPCESAQSDFKKYYYLDESAPQYATRIYPFEFDIQADARYVLLKITGETGSIFSDELAVMKAEKRPAGFNRAYQNTGAAIPMDGVVIRPRVSELAVIRDLPAPQQFVIEDMRGKAEKGKPVSLILDLPAPLKLLSPEAKTEPVEINGLKYLRLEFPLKYNKSTGRFISPTLFLGAGDGKVSAPARIYARCEGQDQFKTELPVKIVELPPIKPFERLHVSLSWMGERNGMDWPEFFTNWRRLGFNTVSSFPRFWKAGNDGPNKAYLDAARKAGFKIIMNDSAFHEMMRGHKADSEIFCQIPGETNKILCPSYRGPYYEKEMERVARCVREGKPDYVFYDIECWHHAAAGASKCTRCQEALQKSGKSMNEFLFDCGTETMRDLDAAVKTGAKQAGIPVPVQGSYNRHALKPLYGIEDFQRIYPAYINMAQPSLYVAGRAGDVHDSIRGNHKLLKNKQIIPWLTAGTYGEFESYKVEQMVLEALLNGAQGVTYYAYGDFTDSPLDFYYHAKALAQIRPYEDLIADGEILEPTGTNKEMWYSGVRKGGEMLLLVGNYVNAPEKTTVRLPFAEVTGIKDLRSGEKVSGASEFTFEVPKSDIRLFYITGQ